MHMIDHLNKVQDLISEIDARLHVMQADGKCPPGSLDKVRGMVGEAYEHTRAAEQQSRAAFARIESAGITAIGSLKQQLFGTAGSLGTGAPAQPPASQVPSGVQPHPIFPLLVGMGATGCGNPNCGLCGGKPAA